MLQVLQAKLKTVVCVSDGLLHEAKAIDCCTIERLFLVGDVAIQYKVAEHQYMTCHM